MKYKGASGSGDAAAFFWSVVPWLSTSATSLRSVQVSHRPTVLAVCVSRTAPTHALFPSPQAAKGASRPFLELFKVVADASRLFASKLSLGSQQTFPLELIRTGCDASAAPMVQIAKQTAPLNISTDHKALVEHTLRGNDR